MRSSFRSVKNNALESTSKNEIVGSQVVQHDIFSRCCVNEEKPVDQVDVALGASAEDCFRLLVFRRSLLAKQPGSRPHVNSVTCAMNTLEAFSAEHVNALYPF